MTLKDQMQKLYELGNKAGLTDAVKFIQTFIIKQEAIEKKKEGKKTRWIK